MKTIRDVMTPNVVWISPTQQAKTAIILMKGHGIDALPVVYSHDSVVGILYCSSLIGQDPETPVVDLMDKDYTVVPPEMPVYQVSDLMKSDGKSHLLVVDAGKLSGIVSRSDIICELGKSYDTLTGLPWQDAFREWSIGALDRGREISVILIDLNLFGKFNKRYGHVMGDNVLKAVAEALKSQIDPGRDFLCRYAGDEFSVATYRPAGEAMEFGRRLIEQIEQIEIEGLPEKVGATFGMAGGRRAEGRIQVHSAATLDDLITNASLNCTLSKPHRPEAAAPEAPAAVSPTTAPAPQPAEIGVRRAEPARLKIQTIRISTTATEATAEVILSRGDEEFAHTASGFSTGGRSTLRLVAEAAAGSAAKSLAEGHGVVIEDVVTFQTGDEREVVTVIATFITPKGSTTHAGSAVVRRSDPYRAATAALLSAINRQIVVAPRPAATESQAN
jgi:diguanylate cyclase (GGDEF)-like protein